MKINLLIAADRLHRWFNNLLIGRDEFCTQCNGPYTGWLRQYGGHWDTCANRENKGLPWTF